MEDLPFDISLDILSRLPISSFLLVKLVCKSWYSLASHPYLNSLHNQQPHNNPSLVLLSTIDSTPHDCNKNCLAQLNLLDSSYISCDKDNEGEVTRKSIKPVTKHKRYKVSTILSCNGLLCFICFKNKYKGKNTLYRVCIYNPLTREEKNLPDLPYIDETPSKMIKSEASRCQRFGFGFNPRTNEYKVVRIVGISKQIKTKELVYYASRYSHVFTLSKTGLWRSKSHKPFSFPMESSDAVVDGAIHWLCSKSHESRIIVSFDLSEEKFKEIPTPPDCQTGRGCGLAVLGGRLAITNHHVSRVDVWVMKEHGVVKSSWTKKLVIVIREELICPAVSLALTRPELVRPICLLSNGKIVISYKNEALYCYDPEEREWLQIFTKKGLLPPSVHRSWLHSKPCITFFIVCFVLRI